MKVRPLHSCRMPFCIFGNHEPHSTLNLVGTCAYLDFIQLDQWGVLKRAGYGEMEGGKDRFRSKYKFIPGLFERLHHLFGFSVSRGDLSIRMKGTCLG